MSVINKHRSTLELQFSILVEVNAEDTVKRQMCSKEGGIQDASAI